MICFFVFFLEIFEDFVLLRFFDILFSFLVFDVFFILKDGNLGSEVRSFNSMLWDFLKGFGLMVEVLVLRFDEIFVVDFGLGYIGRFFEEFVVVCEIVC